MKELGLYIHIPFCKSKCSYCNFNSYPNCDEYQPEYLKALLKEIEGYKEKIKDYIVTTIYIGGGTPSNFLSGGISSIMQKVRECFTLSSSPEISIEANPNTITYERILEWKNAGINRVSVGLQSDNERLLKLLNRTHSKKDFLNAIKLLKQNKFGNINADIMIGLPTQKLSDVKRTLKTLKRCDIQHVSAYCLILEDGTPLKKMVDEGRVKELKEIKVLSMYDFVYNELKKWGIHRYEVSNFALVGHECKHNLNCWDMVEYVGFGAGAHSFLNGTRYYNHSGISDYISAVKDGNAVEVAEPQTTNDLFEEYIMLKLRTAEGISLNRIKDEYNIDLLAIKGNKIREFEKLGLIEIAGAYLRLTDDGFKVLNKIVLELVC